MLGPHSAGQEELVMCWALIALHFLPLAPACIDLIYLHIDLNWHVRVCRKAERATQGCHFSLGYFLLSLFWSLSSNLAASMPLNGPLG